MICQELRVTSPSVRPWFIAALPRLGSDATGVSTDFRAVKDGGGLGEEHYTVASCLAMVA